MRTLIYVIPGGPDVTALPPIVAAARVWPMARRAGCERIRVELRGGVRVAEFSCDTVARFLHRIRAQVVPDAFGRPEPRVPVWPGLNEGGGTRGGT